MLILRSIFFYKKEVDKFLFVLYARNIKFKGGLLLMPKWILDVEVYDNQDVYNNPSVQAKYLVHGINDVLWTDETGEAIMFLLDSLIDAEGKEGKNIK